MTAGKKIFNYILKFIIIIVAFCILLCGLMLSSCSKTQKIDDVTQFEEAINEVYGASTHIPCIEELGEYESVEILTKETKYCLWIINSITLKVKYDTANFEKALNDIELKYAFLKETKEELYDYFAIIDGYEIQVVDKTEKMQTDYSYHYPKCFLMIGVNRQEQTIVYLYHYDIDLDTIKDLDDFINKYYVFE